MCATLTKKFMDCMKEYQKAQVRAQLCYFLLVILN